MLDREAVEQGARELARSTSQIHGVSNLDVLDEFDQVEERFRSLGFELLVLGGIPGGGHGRSFLCRRRRRGHARRMPDSAGEIGTGRCRRLSGPLRALERALKLWSTWSNCHRLRQQMNLVSLGRTHLVVPQLAFGALPIQRLGMEDASRLLRTAFAAGGLCPIIHI